MKYGYDTLEIVDRFYYLENMPSLYGGVTDAVSERIRCAWKKSGKLIRS